MRLRRTSKENQTAVEAAPQPSVPLPALPIVSPPTRSAFSVSTRPGAFLVRENHPALHMLARMLSRRGVVPCVWGESKSGKTTYLRHFFETATIPFIIIPGARIKDAQSFWRTLGEELRL